MHLWLPYWGEYVVEYTGVDVNVLSSYFLRTYQSLTHQSCSTLAMTPELPHWILATSFWSLNALNAKALDSDFLGADSETPTMPQASNTDLKGANSGTRTETQTDLAEENTSKCRKVLLSEQSSSVNKSTHVYKQLKIRQRFLTALYTGSCNALVLLLY